MSRYVLAFDKDKVYLRRTLCVTHDDIKYEAIYRTKPMKLTKKRLARLKNILNKVK